MHSRGMASCVTVALLLLAACKEDLGPIKKTWADTENALGAKLGVAKKDATELKAKLSAVTAPDDAKAKELKGKADDAVAAVDKALADAEAAYKKAQQGVTDALTTGKVAKVKAAIEKGKAEVEGALSKVGDAPKAADAAIDDLKKYADQVVAAAAAKASKLPPEIDPHQVGSFEFSGLDFKGDKPNAGDKAVKENLMAIAGLLNRCDQIKVEIQDHLAGDHEGKAAEKLSLKRAEAVKTWLVKQGKVKAGKIAKVTGMGSSDPLEAEPKDDADKLKLARAKNERVRVKVLKACPKK